MDNIAYAWLGVLTFGFIVMCICSLMNRCFGRVKTDDGHARTPWEATIDRELTVYGPIRDGGRKTYHAPIKPSSLDEFGDEKLPESGDAFVRYAKDDIKRMKTFKAALPTQIGLV